MARARRVKPALRTDESPLLVEVAWEVCSQVGGIYTVLRSKAPATIRVWGDEYWLIGPYREHSAKIELENRPPPPFMRDTIDEFEMSGVRVHCGQWLITGRPNVLLIDTRSVMVRLADIKYYLWRDCGIGSPPGDQDFDESVAFGAVVADVLEAIQRRLSPRPVIAQFHEWQAAGALPFLRQRNIPIATVFTTHATLVGRALSAASANLYDHLTQIDGAAVAYQHGFGHRFELEKAAAHRCDVFTTVSEITGQEAQQFLSRRPDVLLPNGLNIERFNAPHEFQNLHLAAKKRIHDFVMGHFFPSYTFDLDQTLYFFTAGRYEYTNKGFDVFIDALRQLNERMRADPNGVTVVAFIITRAPYRALNVDTLNRQAMFNELRRACAAIKEEMGQRLFETVTAGRMPTIEDLIDEYAGVRLKRMMHAWRAGPPPSIVTHDLCDDAHDAVLQHLRHCRLINLSDDPVKVVFHPEFITSTSPVLGLEYDEFVRGCNLGVFPSYYEPWGYTPMECVVRGIPTITSDLSGFGAYAMEHFADHDDAGMFVARRRGRDFGNVAWQVAQRMFAMTRMTVRERIALRNRVEAYADHFDWNNLNRYYMQARDLAFSRRFPGVNWSESAVHDSPAR